MDAALAEVEAEVAVDGQGATGKEAITQGVDAERTPDIIGEEAETMEVASKNGAN